MKIDTEEGTMGFVIQGNYLGPAFRGLWGNHVYPMVGYQGNVTCNLKIEYIGHTSASLKELCRKNIRQQIKVKLNKGGIIYKMNLPRSLKRHLE